MSCPAHALAESRKEIDVEAVDLIRELAVDLPTSPTVVDLGTGSGTVLLSILAERNDAVHIHSYDLDVQWGQMVVKNEKVQRVGDVTFYEMDVLDPMGASYMEAGIDLLLIDLLPERIGEVFSRWLPLLKPDARVWVHNYDNVYTRQVLSAFDEGAAVLSRGGSSFLIETIEVRGRSWVARRVADESSEDPPSTDDESGPDPKTGVGSADPKEDSGGEEVPPSQSMTEDEAPTSEPLSKPKRAPSKRRSRRKPTE